MAQPKLPKYLTMVGGEALIRKGFKVAKIGANKLVVFDKGRASVLTPLATIQCRCRRSKTTGTGKKSCTISTKPIAPDKIRVLCAAEGLCVACTPHDVTNGFSFDAAAVVAPS